MWKFKTAAMFVALVVACGVLGYGVTWASGRLGPTAGAAEQTATAGPATSAVPEATRAARPSPAATPAAPRTTPPPPPSPKPRAKAVLRPGPRLFGPGDHGPQVRALQARLRQIAWFAGDVTDEYGTVTTAAVRGFQAKRDIPVTGYVDRRTMDRLTAMTHEPTSDELANNLTPAGNAPGRLDPRCTGGRVLCIDKTSRTLRWVVDGTVEKTLDVRFGAEYSPTREGLFHVGWKDADHVSKLYGSAMPYSMFFSGGQAVHYSSDFAARGYAGASHGCVNVRDHAGIAWLYGQVRVGDKVVVYRS